MNVNQPYRAEEHHQRYPNNMTIALVQPPSTDLARAGRKSTSSARHQQRYRPTTKADRSNAVAAASDYDAAR